MLKVQPKDTTSLYRIENPKIAAKPNGITSHQDIVGQWFTPNLVSAINYLRKSTQTFGKDAAPVDGAQLVVAEIPTEQLGIYHVDQHPIASQMDTEGDNYLLPRDGSLSVIIVPLDEVLGDLKGHLGDIKKLGQARERIIARLGELTLL